MRRTRRSESAGRHGSDRFGWARSATAAHPLAAAVTVLVLGWALTFLVVPWAVEPPGANGSGRPAVVALALGLALAVLAFCVRLARLTGGRPARAAMGIALMPLLLGATARGHLDLVPVALVLLAVMLLVEDHPLLGFAALAGGVIADGFPLVVVPVAMGWLVGRGEWRLAAQGFAVFAVVLGALAVGALNLAPPGAADAVSRYFARTVSLDGATAAAGAASGAQSVAAALATYSLAAVVGLLSLTAIERSRPPSLVLAALAALLASAALGRVLSPETMLWVAPLFAMALAWRLDALALLLGSAMALSLVEVPSRSLAPGFWEGVAVGAAAVRNVLLVLSLAVAVMALWGGARRRH